MTILWRTTKIKSAPYSLFERWWFLGRKSNINLLLLLRIWKHLFKNNEKKRECCGIPKASWTLKLFRKPSVTYCTYTPKTNYRDESWNRKRFWCAFGTIFRNCKCVQRRKQYVTFTMTSHPKWFETICTCTEINDLILKKFLSWPSPFTRPSLRSARVKRYVVHVQCTLSFSPEVK